MEKEVKTDQGIKDDTQIGNSILILLQVTEQVLKSNNYSVEDVSKISNAYLTIKNAIGVNKADSE